ncbi:G-protein coupled receptor Mth-like [Scaptodrosophila lebanonensis]|uniref:G-protein coupled receptor Mth-like n=1 Tax=Drosophila lebanonensis TaxID=7225 RepID=A0A6J2TXS9_DROLE|nr:G-protein coupled receptor Mth-like [Scaptodrosophila lebanonensis]
MARIALFIFSILICGLRAHDSTRCDYFDSVDLTNARKLENGSYVFQGILIPAEYTFKHVENQTSIRGCVCEIKPCINLCSPAVDSQGSLSWDVKMKDGNVVNKHLEDLFALQPGSNMQCDWYYDFDPANKSEDMWELLENGSLAVPHAKPSPILPKQMYCFVFHVNNGTLIAKNCIRKIRPYDFPQNYTQIGYFAVMAAFLWLSVISYILWKTLTSKGSHCLLAETGCKKYKLYVWGTATVLLVVSVLADNFVSKSKWKPNFGAYSGWIATDSVSALIYYYGPMSLLIFGNITMFVLTAVDLIKTGITIQIKSV